MIDRLVVCSIAAFAPAFAARTTPLLAQERGGFVTTLGRDTIALERFVWSSDRRTLTGEAVITTPRAQRIAYEVTIADGRPNQIVYVITVPNDTNPPVRIRTTIGSDSVRFTRSQGSRVINRAEPAPAAAIFPENLYTWALYELATRAAASTGADSTSVLMVSPGGPKPYVKVFRRRAPDTLSTMFFFPEYWLNYVLDESGKLLGIDGTHTTIKVLAARRPDVPLDAYAAHVIARERAVGAVGELSVADSVTASFGSARVAVAYSRPTKRGRVVWGGVVPFGEVWRTGANSATRLHLSHTAEVGGFRVPPGSYTLFTIPTGSAATLIINRQVGQWGTEYHQDRDLVRLPLQATRLASSAERFTMGFGAADDTVRTLFLEWDDVRWSVPIRLRVDEPVPPIEPGDARLRTDRIRAGTDSFRIESSAGGQVRRTMMIRTVQRRSVDGREALLFAQRYVTDRGITVDTSWIDARTLAPARYVADVYGEIQKFTFEGKTGTGTVTPRDSAARPVTVSSAAPFFNAVALDLVYAALPLSESLAVSMTVYNPPRVAFGISLRVTGEEDLRLAAGGTIRAWTLDYQLGPNVQKLWLDRRTGEFLRIGSVQGANYFFKYRADLEAWVPGR